MLNIGNKTFMNLQEAVGWLLENNALPFQSTANYVGNTEIAMSTLINPSPAKVRVGSIIFFADSKVSTVVGVTSNSFIVSDQYNDLVDDVVYVSNVAINASGHLIVTLSNGDTIDAGFIKQVSGFSIDASQHLIVTYNDGSTTDLGAIFSGSVNIAGNLTADSIIENMSGYSFTKNTVPQNATIEYVYCGVVKNGNKITFAVAVNLTRTDTVGAGVLSVGSFNIPQAVLDKLYPTNVGGGNYLDLKEIKAFKSEASGINLIPYFTKGYNGPSMYIGLINSLTLNEKFYLRYEATFLLNNSLVS